MKKLGIRNLLLFFPPFTLEGGLSNNGCTNVFLLINYQHFGINTDKGQNKKKAVVRQKWQ